MKSTILLLVFVLYSLYAFSQADTTKSDTLRKDALNVYMQSSDYIRKEIPYINYVRDIKDAGVYIITTYQGTGSGGAEYTYYIVGQKEFAGMVDTVSFVAMPGETSDGIRQQEVRAIKMGLMRYVARTPLSKYINISFNQSMPESVTTDKWNNWVFKPYLYTYINGEESSNYKNIYCRFSANRITKEWKINSEINYSYSVNKYKMPDTTIKTENNSKWVKAIVVKSLTDHWSFGGSVMIGASKYDNYELMYHFMPGIEYDLFPYSQSTRRQLRILYKVGFDHIDFIDSTRYFKIEEGLWLHTLNIAYGVIQKWGSIDIGLEYGNYLQDWSENHLDFYADFSIRIVKGLSLNIYGGYSFIHDQRNIRKGNLSRDEILTNAKAIATTYSYYASFGFSYTFGSIYNNVVNPRFGNGY